MGRGLFSRLFGGGAKLDTGTVEGDLLARYTRWPGGENQWPPPKVETYEGGREILDQDAETRARILVLASKTVASEEHSFGAGLALKSLITRLLRSRLPLDTSDLVSLVEDLCTNGARDLELPAGSVIAAVERHVAERASDDPAADGLDPSLAEALRRLEAGAEYWLASAVQRRLRRLLRDDSQPVANDAWGRKLEKSLGGVPESVLGPWQSLLAHAAEVTGKTRPTKTWLKEAAALVDGIGAEGVRETVGESIDGLVPGPVEGGEPAIGEANSEMLRGLLWAAALRPDRRLVSRLGRLVEMSFRKVRWHGARSPRLGNGALIALGLASDQMQGHDAIAELTRLEGKMRYETAKRTISKELERSALEAGLSRADLEELAIPHYELDAEGRLNLSVGDGEALLEVDGDDIVLCWRRAGRTTKSAPKALREARPERVKEVRELAKQMRQTLAGQAGRIERHYLDDRSLPAPLWRERYLHHPLVRTLSRRLFWSLEDGEVARIFWWRDGALRDLDGREIGELDSGQRVRLWHPVRASVEEVRRARRLLTEARVTQPFKQAYREVYLLTDAERETGTYSNRFAAHILRQHQFQALCQQRGWRYDLQGAFDSFNVPSRSLPAFDLVVEFWVEPVAEDEHTSEMGIYQYLSSDQVVFLRGERLPLEDVPELAFSEAMRDVDLFTSVASVGNDPNWHDRGEGFDDYWQSFAFGDLNATAETRREVLAGLLPLLKIADRCALEDRWLVVRGDRRTYRIHLRSGHVMMDPNQQYLCIVADRGAPRKTSRVYLPFEGDTVLSLILSKAFLLAEDQKIEDPTILSQITAR